jgi:hypothetical protein
MRLRRIYSMKIWSLGLGVAFAMGMTCTLYAAGGAVKKPAMRLYETPNYKLSTDLPEEMAREADLRMTRMFEEYTRRTAGFSGAPREKFPFSMFQNLEDYYAAGGLPGSAGCYNLGTGQLMAFAGGKNSQMTWHIIQHEGFHQFAAATIHAELPPWVNEGLAEYFGEALFTGDSYIPGFINPGRLEIVKEEITKGQWKPFATMTTMTLTEWNHQMGAANYNQAWAMVHFLAHGEDGKYQKAFTAYINQMNRGATPAAAWANVFGKDVAGFQEKCEKWWKALPEYPTNEIYEKATVMRMTSILAREEAQGHHYDGWKDFLAQARPTDLKLSRDLWLPTSFVDEADTMSEKIGTWTLENKPKQMPRLICVGNTSTYTGTFVLNGKKVASINVIAAANSQTQPAKQASTKPVITPTSITMKLPTSPATRPAPNATRPAPTTTTKPSR